MQVNVLVALSDIGPGDGGTLIIPGSHKSNLPHPQQLDPWSSPRRNNAADTNPSIFERLRPKASALERRYDAP